MRQRLWPSQPGEHEGEIEAFFRGELREPQAVLVVESGGELVGFAEVSRRDYAEGCSSSPVGYLEGWYVAPGVRRRGLGRMLVRAAEDWAREKGCTEFASDTEVDNELSASAHEKLGFEEVEIIRCFRKRL